MPREQDKVQAFWDITRQELGDARAAARLKDRELEEAQVRAAGGEGRMEGGDPGISAARPAERSLACRAQPGVPSAAWRAERSLACRAQPGLPSAA